jgi:hypothetical protein
MTKASILSSDYFGVVPDEITYPLIDSSLPHDDALLTVKRACKAGIPAQRGIGD